MKYTTFTRHPRLEKHSAECASRLGQLGGMMIESLVGLLLLSLVGGGVMHATARMANTQQQQAVHNISINQMRAMVMNRKGTAGADICTGNNHTLSVPGKQDPQAVTVKGCNAVNFVVTNVKVGTTDVSVTVSSQRPVILEVGADAGLVRVGGAEVANAPTN